MKTTLENIITIYLSINFQSKDSGSKVSKLGSKNSEALNIVGVYELLHVAE